MKIYIQRFEHETGTRFFLGDFVGGQFINRSWPMLFEQRFIEFMQRKGHDIIDADSLISKAVREN